MRTDRQIMGWFLWALAVPWWAAETIRRELLAERDIRATMRRWRWRL